MTINKNKKPRKNLIVAKYGNVETTVATPFPKSKRGPTLTIRNGKNVINLNGRQINALLNALTTGFDLAV